KLKKIPVKGGENVRLYSPQFVTGESDTIIYMRVTHPIEGACKVVAEPGLFTQRLRYARPGEMNEVRLKAEQIQAKNPDEIIVDIKPL
ncbi:MAG: pyridine nucleotide-disulfide oxidoreductase, partial [Synergistaceae bacterium]|nr:pyridine nucleotide-disulfide oxidoreductase [Synergistaceae bacterium]